MPLPSTGYATATVTNPSAALTDFTLLVDLSRMPAAWWALVDTTDATKGRAAKDAGETELAVDWFRFDSGTETGWARIKWSGTLASTGAQVLRVYPPVAANASVAASDPYGSDNAYNAACLAYVPMHEASGNAADRTATGATCTLDAEAYGVAGQAGPAVEFDGTADDGSLPVNLSGINKVIVECWLYWDAYATDNDIALEYTANISTTGAFQLNPNAATSTLDFTHKTSSGYYSRRYTRPTAAAWHHYAAVIDRPNGVSLYIDGSLATPASTPLTSTESGNFPNSALKLMSRNGASLFGAGRMQHLSLWSARTADEIATEFAQSSDQATFWGTPAWVGTGTTAELAASIQGEGDAIGAASGTAAGAATVEGEGDTTGQVSGTAGAAATLEGEGDASGAATGTAGAAASIEGDGDVSGQASGVASGAASIEGEGDVTGAPTATTIADIAATIEGEGDVTGAISTEIDVDVIVELTAVFVRGITLNAQMHRSIDLPAKFIRSITLEARI